jgi:hypothetical protein
MMNASDPFEETAQDASHWRWRDRVNGNSTLREADGL